MSHEAFLAKHIDDALKAYKAQPARIIEDARREQAILSGGYGDRQLFELVQNAADAISEAGICGRIHVCLTEEALYCANEGAEVTEDGLLALLMADMSPKRRNEIGRFGLGFKSVLGICSNPEIISRAISLRFNPPELAAELRRLVGPQHPLPKLRTAKILALDEEANSDVVLCELADWATTVVKLPLLPGVVNQLATDIAEFPCEFLAFSPHVARLEMVSPGGVRTLSATQEEDGFVTISSNDDTCRWRLFGETVLTRDLSPAAYADMDLRLQEREALPLIWAVPLDNLRQRGALWAFFPTMNDTTLRGILNAPWKTNSDRENLLEGAFNAELLDRAAQLVAANVPFLGTDEDPGQFLDVLPAREDVGWADKALSGSLYEILRERACMPRDTGDFDVPRNVALRPAIADEAQLREWLDVYRDSEPEGLVHECVKGRDRRARARLLGCTSVDELNWLKYVIAVKSPKASIAAIHLADALLQSKNLRSGEARNVRSEPIVLTITGKLVRADPAILAFPDGDQEAQAEHDRLVHPEIVEHPGARRILEERFGIQSVDMPSALKALVVGWTRYNDSSAFWERFWKLVRAVGVESAQRILANCHGWWVKARTITGGFEAIYDLLLPGTVADAGDPEAESALIDLEFHRDDGEMLNFFGASSHPTKVDHLRPPECQANDIYAEHSHWAPHEYRRQNPGQSPQIDYLVFRDAQAIAPLEPLRHLKGRSAVNMTDALLAFAREQPHWMMGHHTLRRKYPDTALDSAITWAVRRYGWIDTSLGPARCQESVGSQLSEWSSFFSVAQVTEEDAAFLQLPSALTEINEQIWELALEAAQHYSGIERPLTSFYARAAEAGIAVPDEIRCQRHGEWVTASPADVMLVRDPADVATLEDGGGYYLCASDEADAQILAERWELGRAAAGELRFIASSDALLVSEQYPGLATAPDLPADLRLQPCESLWLEQRSTTSGSIMTPIEQYFREGCLYYVGEQDAKWILTQLAVQFPNALDEELLSDAIRQADEQARQTILEEIRCCGSLEEKLIAAVGVGELRSRIPQRHLERLSQTSAPSPEAIAKLALAVYGIGVLQEYREAFVRLGLQPPRRWNRDAQAVAFVRDLGFPEEFAGYGDARRAPWEDTIGPVSLGELHDYQKPMCDEIIKFLQSATPGRGILSLPTGAGKTRVAVQSIIEWIKARNVDGKVLWIAQSDELCEQSVESWLQAWRALGPNDARLRVNRMWGRTNERVRAPQFGSTLIVATYQTLVARLDRRDFEWALSPDVVVIDEAHGATAPSYTQILRRFGLDQHETRIPLIGLTATPFRGDSNEDETWRLAFRFEHRRFDRRLGEPEEHYRKLQEIRALAWADHDELAGEDIVLTPEELTHLKRFMDIPASVEERLSNAEDWNDRILDHIRRQADDWPILVFAASVNHAEDLAVRLSVAGTPATAISGSTPSDRRRHAIASFKRGETRVLTNYGVLTTGFDAPAVRAVYVTRPVYSPVLYQQMIGRGLRGPLNRGKERCLIVNVTDNVRQYGQELAFHKFEHMWTR